MADSKRKREAARVSSGPMSIWDALQSALDEAPKARPADSVTAEEFAARLGCKTECARRKLKAMANLRVVDYLQDGRRGKCYVVAE